MSSRYLADPINLVYLTVLGLLLGYLLGGNIARRWARAWKSTIRKVSRIPPEAVLAAGVGTTIALIITVLLNSLLENVPGFTWYWSLLLTALLVTASSWFFVANRQLFNNRTWSPNLALPEKELGSSAKVIDTSAIIDGRILDVIEANFIDAKLLIPKFVLGELQQISDSEDPLKRKRGRRGLEILDKLVQQRSIPTEVISDDFAGIKAVDEKLVKLCQTRQADLITTDYNLNRVAALQNIKVLNVNQLSNAIKAVFLPGERLSLYIVKAGREPGQGLAYLEDGTMIVIEDAAEHVGKTVEVVVSSHLQTNMGRMIFAKLDEARA